MLKPSFLFLLLVLAPSLLLAIPIAPPPNVDRHIIELDPLDAISLALSETEEAIRYMMSLPHLHGMKKVHFPDLKLCVESLVFGLESITPTLRRMIEMRDLPSFDTGPLKDGLDLIVDMGRDCGELLVGDFDGILVKLLDGKLNNLSMVVDDVCRHVGSHV